MQVQGVSVVTLGFGDSAGLTESVLPACVSAPVGAHHHVLEGNHITYLSKKLTP